MKKMVMIKGGDTNQTKPKQETITGTRFLLIKSWFATQGRCMA
jgi:hypothetical protein